MTLADTSDFGVRALESGAQVACVDPAYPGWVSELDSPVLVAARGSLTRKTAIRKTRPPVTSGLYLCREPNNDARHRGVSSRAGRRLARVERVDIGHPHAGDARSNTSSISSASCVCSARRPSADSSRGDASASADTRDTPSAGDNSRALDRSTASRSPDEPGVRLGTQPGGRTRLGARLRAEEQPDSVANGRAPVFQLPRRGARECALPAGSRGDAVAHPEHEALPQRRPATVVPALRSSGNGPRQPLRRVKPTRAVKYEAGATRTVGAASP